ncbi:DUF5058 family protein [Vallitalea okinawensis]|uniref:DUF5058 family protein n=1 Tax=Vallitalea okinawensis TaxID=2078660 RepID=UPI000CFB7AB7|nr:DUF5058 family protein [Vallitalea okinawensis]
MGDYLNIANSNIFYICGAIILLIVVLQSYLFIKLAFKKGKEQGLSKEKMFKALRTGAISSVVPSIAIIVALMTMVPVLGVPIPWMRLSVIGSAPYELMAAGIGSKSMGIDQLGGPGYTKEVFASSIWVMCFGSIWAVGLIILFLKSIKKQYSKTVDKDPQWKTVLINAAFLGVFCIFIADPVTTGGLPLYTLLSGGVIMTILALLIVKFKVTWLREFALTFSMIGAMLCSILFSNLGL